MAPFQQPARKANVEESQEEHNHKVVPDDKGKLPGEVVRQDYALEYGTDTVEIQQGLIENGTSVVIADDLLATGGTMRATGDLVRKIGGTVSLGLCIIELNELGGRGKLDFPFTELVQAPLDPLSGEAPGSLKTA